MWVAGHDHEVLSDADRRAIREQLDRLLANPFFSHSKRFPNFLRFVVERTLAGDAENIKERTLGIEIFGRDADYDTASDPSSASPPLRFASGWPSITRNRRTRRNCGSTCFRGPTFHNSSFREVVMRLACPMRI